MPPCAGSDIVMVERRALAAGADEWTLGGLRGRHALPDDEGPELTVVSSGDGGDSDGPDDPDRPFPTKRGLLSKAEVEMLLRPDLSDMDEEAPVATTGGKPHSVGSLDLVLFDSDSDADDIGACEIITTRMIAALRRDGQLPMVLELASVGGEPDLSEQGMIHAVFETRDGDPVAGVSLTNELVQTVLNRLCGQPGAHRSASQPMDIGDAGRAVLKEALAPLASALSLRVGADVALRRIESDQRLARLVQTGLEHDNFTIRASCDDAESRMVVRVRPVEKARDEDSPERSDDRLECLEARLYARLMRKTVSVGELSELAPGKTLLLGVPSDQPVEMVTRLGSGDQPIADGRVGRSGGQIAVKLTRRVR